MEDFVVATLPENDPITIIMQTGYKFGYDTGFKAGVESVQHKVGVGENLISRSALLDSYDVRKVTEYDESGCGLDYKAVPVEAIEKAPTVDAVEVVRCRDCTRSEPTALSEEYVFCNHSCMVVLESDYCSYGEPKMDAEVSE